MYLAKIPFTKTQYYFFQWDIGYIEISDKLFDE